ncbi:MAG: PQQ-binding-like beta-propeller repeat protein [Kiritimatiellia bacterium]
MIMAGRGRSCLLTALAIAVVFAAWTGRPAVAAAEAVMAGATPSEQRRFVVKAEADKAAASYEVTIKHCGLMRTDGRDLMIIDPAGKPASQMVAFVDETDCRVIFDGAGGVGPYTIRFGNLTANIAAPQGVVQSLGRKEWTPVGGFTAQMWPTSKLNEREKVTNLGKTLEFMKQTMDEAVALDRAAAAKEPDAAKRAVPLVRQSVERGFGMSLPEQWVAIIRAEVTIPKTGEYEFYSEGSRAQFRVLLLDGDRTVIRGWFEGQQLLVSEVTGKAKLSQGRHVLELYTSVSKPELRFRAVADATAPIVSIGGREASYDATALKIGPVEAAEGALADAVLATAEDWLAQGRFAESRQVCRAMKDRLIGDKVAIERLRAVEERGQVGDYEANWLTESKYPNRAGAVTNVTFQPPFRMDRVRGVGVNQNMAWRGSAVYAKGGLIVGVPWEVQDTPWGITSASCVGENTLFAATKNGTMMAISISTGKMKWSFPAEGNCVGCPLLYRGLLYFGGVDRRLYALDAETGRMVWNYPAKGWIEGGACGAGGLVVFGSRDGFVYGVDGALGVERWKVAMGAPVVGTPASDGKAVYVGDRNGNFVALGLQDGRELWKYTADAEIRGGSCVADGKVYFGDGAGKVHAVATDSGKPAWAQPANVGGPVVAAPILVGTNVFGGTLNNVAWGVNATDGVVTWTCDQWDRDGFSGFARPPLFVGNRLFFIPEGLGLVYQFELLRPFNLSDEEKGAGFVSMFNGEDFIGWRFTGDQPADKVSNWKVAYGVIQLSGGGNPHLATDREYANFEMRFEWRAMQPEYNSGLFIRSGKNLGSNQLNLMKDSEGDFVGGKVEGAKGVGHLQKPSGEWNEWRVIVNQDKVTLTCNGKLAWEATGLKPEKGYIGLQAEGAPLEFRRLRIREIK